MMTGMIIGIVGIVGMGYLLWGRICRSIGMILGITGMMKIIEQHYVFFMQSKRCGFDQL